MDYQLAFSSFSAALLELAGSCLIECGAIKGVDLKTSGVILFFLASSGTIKTNVRKCLSTFSVTGKRDIFELYVTSKQNLTLKTKNYIQDSILIKDILDYTSIHM